MTQAIMRPLSFMEFVDFEDGNELHEYKLVSGRLLLMPNPDDWHE